MTEQFETEVGDAGAPSTVRTGIASIDDILVEVDSLSDRTLGEHVAVFTQAHEQLRCALEIPADPA